MAPRGPPPKSPFRIPKIVFPDFPVRGSVGGRPVRNWETGGILFREYCFGEKKASLSSAANSVSSATNSVSSGLHTNNRLRGTH